MDRYSGASFPGLPVKARCGGILTRGQDLQEKRCFMKNFVITCNNIG